MPPVDLSSAGGSLVLSGIQPTGVPHLGNYLGAIANWVRLQDATGSGAPPAAPQPDWILPGDEAGSVDDGAGGGVPSTAKRLYSIVDLHAITVPGAASGAALRARSRETAAALLACGLDPARNTLFVQSAVPQHAELAWILGCLTPLGWLRRMTQFKDKAGGGGDGDADDDAAAAAAGLGLFSYPVLMAADILLYRASHVPVGDDQTQHLELARDIAHAFNQRYGGGGGGGGDDADNDDGFTFPLPQGVFVGAGGARVMSLRDGTKKMSKSDPAARARIDLTDSADDIAKKIKKAQTDTLGPLVAGEDLAERGPGLRNLVEMYAALKDIRDGTDGGGDGGAADGGAADGGDHALAAVCAEFDGLGMGAGLKPALTQLLVDVVVPIGDECRRLCADTGTYDPHGSTGVGKRRGGTGGGHVDDVLAAGGAEARRRAEATMAAVRAAVGLAPAVAVLPQYGRPAVGARSLSRSSKAGALREKTLKAAPAWLDFGSTSSFNAPW